MRPSIFYIKKLVELAFEEDISRRGDRTTDKLFDTNHKSNAHIISKKPGIFCGTDFISQAFKILDDDVKIKFHKQDGDQIKANDVICEIISTTSNILSCERVALNFMSKLTGISTLTNEFVKLIDGRCQLLCTRKTTPLLRVIEKYACSCGGALNHRFGLDDAIMIKDNHIKAFGNLRDASIKATTNKDPFCKVEIEVDNIDQLKKIIDLDIDIILLDNFTIDDITKAVKYAKDANPKILLEASGNINYETIEQYSKTGIDYISSGYITHHATWHDFSLEIL